VRHGAEMLVQLVADTAYLAAARQTIPPEFLAPGEAARPLFAAVDFGLVQGDSGEWEPRLVELQGFPSLYAYQPVLAEAYREIYGLDGTLRHYLGGLEETEYVALFKTAILGSCEPENVVLLEVHPREQKTLPDFLLTERMTGIRTVCITEVEREGRRLFYRREGRRIPIRRIYNRAIADEVMRKNISASFCFCDDLDVEWAGHPNWFFLISKFSLPYLRHPAAPKAFFLDWVPENPRDFVLKPLYSFAGRGVVVGPEREELERIPPWERRNYIVQERLEFTPVIQTPAGPTKIEIRILYIWLDELKPVETIIRMGRGQQMGVDHNRNRDWVGGSAGFYTPAAAL